ncbi:MFS transporter [Rhodococcus aerolatus]
MTLLDISIVNVALPSIRESTGASVSQLQWVVSGYALAFGMVPIIGGRLGDDRGRRFVLLAGIAGFAVTSLVVGAAPNPGVLVAARVLQGLAGGLLNPQVAGLVQQLFPREERGRAFGVIGTGVGVATALGPVLGGGIIALGGPELGWRLAFLVNVPVGIASFVLCRRWIPTDAQRSGESRKRTPLDLVGVGLLALGLFGILFPAVQYDSTPDARLTLVLVPAAAVLTGFLWWERGPARRHGHPLIDVTLFRFTSYTGGLFVALLYFAAFTATPLVLSLLLQEGLGFSALSAGLVATAFAIGTAVSAPIGGRWVNRAGQRVLVVALVLFVVGIAGAALVAELLAGQVSGVVFALVLAGPLLVAGLGGGSVITPNQALSLAEVPTEGGSTAGGMLQTSQRVGGAIGVVVISAVFYASAGGVGATDPAGRADGFGHAYTLGLLVTTGFAVLALALVVTTGRRHPGGDRGPDHDEGARHAP